MNEMNGKDLGGGEILDVSLAKPTDKNLRAKKMARQEIIFIHSLILTVDFFRFAQRQQQFGGWGYGYGCHGGYGGYHQQAHYADCLKQCILGYSNLFIKYDKFILLYNLCSGQKLSYSPKVA